MTEIYGVLRYSFRLQTSLHHLPSLQERPYKRSSPTTSRMWRPWYGTSIQYQAYQYNILK